MLQENRQQTNSLGCNKTSQRQWIYPFKGLQKPKAFIKIPHQKTKLEMTEPSKQSEPWKPNLAFKNWSQWHFDIKQFLQTSEHRAAAVMECKNNISCDLEDADMIGIQIPHAYSYA